MSAASRPLSATQSTSAILQSVAAITSQRDRDLLEKTLTQTLVELLPGATASVYRIAEGEQGTEAQLVACAPMAALRPSSLLVAEEAHFSQVIASKSEWVVTQGSGHPVQLIYPISDAFGVIGLLEVTAEDDDALDRRLVFALLKIYSNYLALLNESETDTLTGLLNRRTFDMNLEKIIGDQLTDAPLSDQLYPIRRANNENLPHWLAIIDIDHFKRINDELGHLYGDEVLILLARNMQRIFRQRDKLFRFGGEEFVVVLDRASSENALAVLERFRTAIEHYAFPQINKVTVSIGYVCLSHSDVHSAIIGRADQALYYAKHHGRNRVCQYEKLVAQGKLIGEHFSDDLQLF